jgi:hypothetical protein
LRQVARRLRGGKPLREAMKAGGYNRLTLAARTREVDPDGNGVSHQLIYCVASDRDWARDTCSPASARLIAAALGKPEEALFKMPVSLNP